MPPARPRPARDRRSTWPCASSTLARRGSNVRNRAISSRVVPITSGRSERAAAMAIGSVEQVLVDGGGERREAAPTEHGGLGVEHPLQRRVGQLVERRRLGGTEEVGRAPRRPPRRCAAGGATGSSRRPGRTARRRPAVPISAIAEEPPADSPNTVTLVGSPPNEAIWSWTHCERGDLVAQPAVRRAGEAERTEPVVDRDHDDVAAVAQVRRVVPRHRRPSRWCTRRRGSTPARDGGRRRPPGSTRRGTGTARPSAALRRRAPARRSRSAAGSARPARWRRARRPTCRCAPAGRSARRWRSGCRGTPRSTRGRARGSPRAAWRW